MDCKRILDASKRIRNLTLGVSSQVSQSSTWPPQNSDTGQCFINLLISIEKEVDAIRREAGLQVPRRTWRETPPAPPTTSEEPESPSTPLGSSSVEAPGDPSGRVSISLLVVNRVHRFLMLLTDLSLDHTDAKMAGNLAALLREDFRKGRTQ